MISPHPGCSVSLGLALAGLDAGILHTNCRISRVAESLVDSNLKIYTFTLTLEAQYHCGFCQSGKTNRNLFFSACLVKLLDRFPELHLSIKMCQSTLSEIGQK